MQLLSFLSFNRCADLSIVYTRNRCRVVVTHKMAYSKSPTYCDTAEGTHYQEGVMKPRGEHITARAVNRDTRMARDLRERSARTHAEMQRFFEREKEDRRRFRQELIDTGIGARFDELLELCGSMQHVDELYRRWAEDTARENDGLPLPE
jgi:hypothetical protein